MKKLRFILLPVAVLSIIMSLSAICFAEDTYTKHFDEATGTYTISGTGYPSLHYSQNPSAV